MKKKGVIFVLLFVFLFSIVGCTKNKNEKTELEKKQEEIYQLAKTSGYNGSYEDWLETIKGVDGTSITKVEINQLGELIISLSNGTTTNLGVVKGTDGKDGVGISNVNLNDSCELIITFTNGQTKNLGKIVSEKESSTSVSNVEINSNGELILSFSDGTNKNLGSIQGNDGKNGTDGVGIKDIYINVSGNLIVELSDGTTKNLGKIGGSQTTVEGVVPVYEGMTLESNDEVAVQQSLNKKGRKFEDSIKDFLDIVTTEKVEYYANKGELFNVVIHLYNPSSYEIMSLTINNYKYQSYEFKEGSTSTKLIVQVDAGQISGLKEYTIDAIKYIDGTQIKDVKMDGEKTVKAGVKYDLVPTAKTIAEEVKTSSFSTIVEIKDDTNLMNQSNGIHFFMFDGQNIVSHQILKIGINNIEVTGLLMGTEYDYMIVGVYDDFSGIGKQANQLISSNFTTLDGFVLNSFESTQDCIKLSINNQDTNATFKSVELYKDNELVNTNTAMQDIEFNNLLSNNEYEVRITYSYMKDNVERTAVVVKKINTIEKLAPSFTINSFESNKKTISYKLEDSDIDLTKVSFKAQLYKGVSKVAELDTLEGIFENLLSNTLYDVVFEYSYDLSDGAGVLTLTRKESIKTVNVEEPLIDVTYNKQSESLSYKETRTDVDSVITSVVYKLYKGSILIGQTQKAEYVFENLSSNTEYKLEVTYKFNLNDGEGEQIKQNTYTVLLSKEVPSISLSEYIITQSHIEYNILINDPNSVGRVNMIALYADNTFLKRLDETTTVLESLSSNTSYNIRVNYVYDLDDGNGSKEINYKYSFTTLKQEPSIEINLNSRKKDSLDFTYYLNDPDNALTFKKLDLYHNGVLVKTYTEISKTLFEGLLSDNEYKAEVTFEKDLNNGSTIVTAYTIGKTLALSKPVVDILLESKRSEISYSYTINDVDKISTLKSIDLYYQGTKLDVKDNNKVFTNLYTDSEYEVVITLLNDYKNGNSAVEEQYKKTIKTDSFDIPTLSLELTSTTDTINYDIEYVDLFN